MDLDDLLGAGPDAVTIPNDWHPNAFADGFIADKLLAYFKANGIDSGATVAKVATR